jgi:VanZ family protein
MRVVLRRDFPLLAISVSAVLAAVIAVLTLTQLPSPQIRVPGSDKVHHLLAFAALAFPLSAARPRLAPWVVLGVVAYGGIIEIIQPYTGRQAEWGDLVADAGGAILGSLLGVLIGLWRTRG